MSIEKRNVIEDGRTPGIDKQAELDAIDREATAIIGRLPPPPGFEGLIAPVTGRPLQRLTPLGAAETEDANADKAAERNADVR